VAVRGGYIHVVYRLAVDRVSLVADVVMSKINIIVLQDQRMALLRCNDVYETISC
jgi:hypothetical protein